MKAKMHHIIDGKLHRTIELAGYDEYEVTIIYHPGGESMTLDVGRLSEYMCAWLREGGVLVAALTE